MTQLADHYPSDKQYSRWDHNLYRPLRDAITKTAVPELLLRHVHRVFNGWRHIPFIVSDLPKLDLLHIMYIGMLDYLQKWILHIVRTYERLDKYNAIVVSVPAYNELTPKEQSYEEVSQ
jgi:hypothetical protein